MSTEKPLFRAIFATLFLSTGAALLTYILFNISLGIGLLFAFAVIAGAIAWRLARMDSAQRKSFWQLIGKGAVIGLLATAAYDISRVFVVFVFGWNLSPFKAFPYFGQAIAGENLSYSTAFAVGAIYHVINGLFFSISYCLLFRGKHWIYGIFWALGLELLMFTIYPTWLNLDAVLVEFTVVSLSGHLIYGAVLGVLARKSLIKG
jgi:hypothetical protein